MEKYLAVRGLERKKPCHPFELAFFTKPPQCKNGDVTNFILALPLEMNKINEAWDLEI